jgi:SAM-dependent methyltransferase
MDATVEAERVRAAYSRRAFDGRYLWSNPGQLFMMQQLERRLLRMLEREGQLPLARRRILEVGCGSGHFLRELVKWGATPDRLTGIDLLEDRVEAARRLCPRGVVIEQMDAVHTSFAAGSFDLVLQFTVFTSILSDETRSALAREMRRVTAPGGCIVWYDFRIGNPSNPDVRAVTRRQLRQLFPGARMAIETATLAPPLARRLAPVAWWLCSALASIPLLRTHQLAIIRPEPS